MNSSKSSWLNGLGLRSPGLMLGVEKSRVGMSCNLFKVSFYFGIHPWSELMREDLKKTFSFCKKPTDPKPEWHICSGTNWLASCLDCSRLRKAFRNICSKGTSLNNIRFFDRLGTVLVLADLKWCPHGMCYSHFDIEVRNGALLTIAILANRE